MRNQVVGKIQQSGGPGDRDRGTPPGQPAHYQGRFPKKWAAKGGWDSVSAKLSRGTPFLTSVRAAAVQTWRLTVSSWGILPA